MRRFAALALALLPVSGCIHEFRRVDAQPLPQVAPGSAPWVIGSPVRAYLVDGSVLLFRNGAEVDGRRLTGQAFGMKPDRALFVSSGVPLDSLVGAEVYTGRTDVASTLVVTIGATAAMIAATPLLVVAIFGSCPTVYDGTTGQTVEAELFSNAIAPLLEHRDVDRLAGVQVPADGRVVLDVRNEAVETHYHNLLELLVAEHGPDESVYPSADGRFVRLRALRSVAATSRDGIDATERLARADGAFYESPDARLAAAHEADLTDHLDLTVETGGRDTVALVLRVRNSLLSTRLLYDAMLAGQGAAALDWMGRDLQRFDRTVELSTFIQQRFGVHVHVRPAGTDAPFRPVARVGDGAPSAWEDAAVVLPTGGAERLDVRLVFSADAMHLDRVAVAEARGFLRPRRVPVAHLSGSAAADASVLDRLARPDTSYAVVMPGQRFTATFELGPSEAARTVFLAGQGYYTEWMRPEWLATPRPRPFRATDSTLVATMHRWAADRHAYAERFDRARVPVR